MVVLQKRILLDACMDTVDLDLLGGQALGTVVEAAARAVTRETEPAVTQVLGRSRMGLLLRRRGAHPLLGLRISKKEGALLGFGGFRHAWIVEVLALMYGRLM